MIERYLAKINNISVIFLKINILKRSLCVCVCLILLSCDKKNQNISSYNLCEQTLPPFNEKFNDKSNANLLKTLCACIWDKFPEDGWERKVSKKLYNGEDIGWKIKSFSTVFESNLKSCKEIILKNE